jgi:hypothetical protein
MKHQLKQAATPGRVNRLDRQLAYTGARHHRSVAQPETGASK